MEGSEEARADARASFIQDIASMNFGHERDKNSEGLPEIPAALALP